MAGGVYNFTGNGAGVVVTTAELRREHRQPLRYCRHGSAGTLWIDGNTPPVGSAPPDFNAYAVKRRVVRTGRLKVDWTATGAGTFRHLTTTGLTIDLQQTPNYSYGVIQRRFRENRPQVSGLGNPLRKSFRQTSRSGSGSAAKVCHRLPRKLTSRRTTSAVAVFTTLLEFETQVPYPSSRRRRPCTRGRGRVQTGHQYLYGFQFEV